MSYIVEPMRVEDIPDVTAIERESFTTPWPVYAYRRELKDSRNSSYIVVRWIEPKNGLDESPANSADKKAGTEAAVSAAGTINSTVKRAVSRLFPFLRGEGSARPAREEDRGTVVGYAGLWMVLDEGHVTTIAVRPDLRGHGLGELLLVRLIEIAQEMGARRMTLEVRVSNEIAQNLYRKYTFKVEGVRRRYYSDDNEDAYIMWSDSIETPDFKEKLAAQRAHLRQRFAAPPKTLST